MPSTCPGRDMEGYFMQVYKRITNIPMETLRSVVAIADAGSLTRAGMALGLSQPALSAQIKKLESLIGGSIFRKAPIGSVVTELGNLVVLHARRIMESNDQLLGLRGDSEINRSFRLGISDYYAEALFRTKGEIDLTKITIVADRSAVILASLLEGYIDAALVLAAGEVDLDLSFRKVNERDVPLAWVRSHDFVLSPGAPIPVLTWPGQVTNEIMIRSLEKAGMNYRIAFSSPDHHATLAAARAGAGLMVLPANVTLSGLVQAHEYYLPSLCPAKLLLCERRDAAAKEADLFKFLSEAFFGRSIGSDDTTTSNNANPVHLDRNGLQQRRRVANA